MRSLVPVITHEPGCTWLSAGQTFVEPSAPLSYVVSFTFTGWPANYWVSISQMGKQSQRKLSHSLKITHEDHDDFPGSHSMLTTGRWQIKKRKMGLHDFKSISFYQ